MIKIDFTTGITVYIIFSIGIVFSLWIFYNYRSNKELQNLNLLQQCPYCTYLFIDFFNKPVLMCPRCHSYIEQGTGTKLNHHKEQSNVKDT